MLLATLLLSGCMSPATFRQENGLPTLRLLNWGVNIWWSARWSPDGKWIAVDAGSHSANAHLQVVSPDGGVVHDLASWNCGEAEEFDYAWLSDSQLSCFRMWPVPQQMCIGHAPFSTCQTVPLPPSLVAPVSGASWTPDGRFALISAEALLPNNTSTLNPDLWVVDRRGQLVQQPGVL